ncbi:piggyBac transposable element-derived protein 4-like [Bicyclus anynana]|uniref:PiggyBac transposable element-derived protein 4-like n=1 Tax=Bicyclus anynana TaxID=110368 RepID=A0ABM3M2S9_BICAN|nr:piggyBac transposable element-derived protein 4-like [Bicyclus anynana]
MDEFDFELTQEDLTQLENIEINFLNHSFQIDTDDEDVLQPTKRRCRRIVLSESEDSDSEIIRIIADNIGNTSPSDIWSKPKGNQRKVIPFTEHPGLSTNLCLSMRNKSPADFFILMVPDSIFQEIVELTNQFATHKITSFKESSRFARLRKWVPTDLAEIKKFFGLILIMGITKLPRLAEYWSTNVIVGHPFPRTIMSRNRFELILQMLHFSQNDETNKDDRLHRIRYLLQALNERFQMHYTPGQDLCIDESVVPFRGRIVFRQYNKQKRHKYGIKEFKLCCVPGYTYKISIYAGKNNEITNTTPYNVVMDLLSGLLNKGYTLYTDNWYTSIALARALLKNETHLVGTIRKNRRHLPKKVVSAKLKKGEYIARESRDGITVMKWRDKRDVLVLSTKHSDRFGMIKKRQNTVMKPQIIIDYNKAKGAVDLSDQMAAYSSPLRKTVKWYKKLAVDLLLNTAMVNALTLYKSVTKKNMQMVDFRRFIMMNLCGVHEDTVPDQRPKRIKHCLEKKDGSGCKKHLTRLTGDPHGLNGLVRVGSPVSPAA